jgi:hypothetical protein
MNLRHFILLVAIAIAAPLLHAEVKASQVENQLRNLRSVPEDQKPATIIKLAADISSLPANSQKVSYADALEHLSTEGDMGKQALQAVADTLTAALIGTPVAAKGDKVPMPY